MKNEKLICRAASCIAAAVMAIAAIGAASGVKDKSAYVPGDSGLSDGYSESDAAAAPEGTGTRPPVLENANGDHGRETTGRVTTEAPNGGDGTESEPTVETSAADTEKIADSIRDELGIDDPYGGPDQETSTVVIPPETEAPETTPPTTEPPETEAPGTEPPESEPPATGTPATGEPATGTPVTGAPATGTPATGETTEAVPLTTEPTETDPVEADPVETDAPETDPAVTEPAETEETPETNDDPE